MKKRNKKEILIICLIIFVAIFIRIFKFGTVPAGINQDEAMAAVDAKALANYGTDRLGMSKPTYFTAWGYGQMSVLLSYLMVLLIKIFGFNIIIMRLPNLIISLGGLIFLYLFSKDVFGKKNALIILFLAAINPWHIMQSRWALDCNLFPHLLMAGLYFLNHFKLTKKKINLIISMLIFGLSMYSYGISIYVVPLFLLIATIYLYKIKMINFKDIIIAFLPYLFIAWPFILTMIINVFKLKSIKFMGFTMPYFKKSIRSSDIIFFSNNIFSQLIINLASLLKIILQFDDLLWNNISFFGTMYIFSIPLFLLGLVLIVKKINNYNFDNGLYLIFFVTAIISGLITGNVNVNRINIIFYPLIIANGLGISYLLKQSKLLKSFIPILYCISFTLFSIIYFTSYNNKINELNYFDFANALKEMKKSNAENLYITADSQYIGAKDVSEILTLFYHDIDAKYYQNILKDKLGKTFSERYHFDSIRNLNINESEDAEYLITYFDLKYFNSDKFKFKKYGKYYIVTKIN